MQVKQTAFDGSCSSKQVLSVTIQKRRPPGIFVSSRAERTKKTRSIGALTTAAREKLKTTKQHAEGRASE